MDVRMPNGQLITGVPDNTTKQELYNKLKSSGYDIDSMLTAPIQEPKAIASAPIQPQPEDRRWYGLSKEGLTKGFGTELLESARQFFGGTSQAAIDALPNSINETPPGVTDSELMLAGGPQGYYKQMYGITSDEQLRAVKKQITADLTAERKASEARAEKEAPEDMTLLESGIRSGAASLIRNLPGIGASVLTGNPVPALALAGFQTGADSYGKARAEGVSPTKAARYAGIDSTIEVATELLPTKFLLKAFGADSLKGVSKEILKFTAGEIGGEELATFGQSVNAYWHDLDEELAAAKTPEERSEIHKQRAILTALATIVSGGAMSSAALATQGVSALRGRKGRAAPEEVQREEVTPAPEETAVAPEEAEVAPEEVAPVTPPAPPREVLPELQGLAAFEAPPEVIEGVPPAVIESAKNLLALVDEGKTVNLFRARSVARQLGADIPADANKETTLTALRDTLALATAPKPEAVEVPEVTAPEAKPQEAPRFFAPKTTPIEADVLAGKEVRPPTDDVYEVAEANFNYPRMVGNQTVPINELKGGVPEQAREQARVDQLANRISSDEGYFSRIIVDQNNNVIEGQHRLEALRKLGAKEVPVYKIEDMGDTFPVAKMESAILKAQPMREQQATQIVQQALTAIAETGSVQGAAQLEIPGFQKGYLAALNAIEPVEVPSEPARAGVSEAVAEPSGRGVELPVLRPEPTGPEVTSPAPAGLGRAGLGAEPVAVGEAADVGALKPEATPKVTLYNGRSGKLYDEEALQRKNLSELRGGKKLQQEGIDQDTLDKLSAATLKEAENSFDANGNFIGDKKYRFVSDRNNAVYMFNDLEKARQFSDSYGQRKSTEPVEKRKRIGVGERGQTIFENEQGIRSYRESGFKYTEEPGKPRSSEFKTVDELAAPSETPSFPSIEPTIRLNEARPSIVEDARERAPSLRREANKVKTAYESGKITADVAAEEYGNALLRTQKERVVQPRQRGAEFIRERLMNAVRNDQIPREGAELASWFIQQNPLLVDDLGISIRKAPENEENVAANYENISRVVNLFKERGSDTTAVHEILHHTERLMPANIRAGLTKAYMRQLLKAQKAAKTDIEKSFFKALVDYQMQGNLKGTAFKNEYDAALDAIKKGYVSYDNYQYVNPSEFWAVNGSRLVQGRYGVPPTVTGQLKRWLREFIQKVKSALGLKSDAAVIRALDSLAKADGTYQTDRMLSEAPEYLSVEPPKDLVEVRKRAAEETEKSSPLKTILKQFEGHQIYNKFIRKFADVTDPIMRLDKAKKDSELLITMGPNRNDVASELVRSPNITDLFISRYVSPLERSLQNAVGAFARLTGQSVDNASHILDSYLIAIHEEKRRETKYLRNVGLRNDILLPVKSLPFAEGQKDMTPADYREYLEGLRSKLPPEQAAKIQDVMRFIVDKFKSPRGASPVAVPGKPLSTDINDKAYDVVPRKIDGRDAYTPEFLRAARDYYNNLSGPVRDAIDDVRRAKAKIHDAERDLSRAANYWPPALDSIIASYQWGDTYSSFQGIPNADDSLDYSSKKLSGELTEKPQAFDGRTTDFNSPLLQSMDNARRAAARVGRKDLVDVIVNNIHQGFLRAKSKEPKVFTFEDRRAPDFDFDQLNGGDKVLQYQPNGDVHVYSLKDQEKLDALKGAYRKLHPTFQAVLDVSRIPKFTTFMAQGHTRLNMPFAPMDFLMNTMSYLGNMITDTGGLPQGGRYLAQTVADVFRGGLFTKTGYISKVLSSKGVDGLAELRKSKNKYIQNAADLIELGGSSLFRQAMGLGVQRDELIKAAGSNKMLKNAEQVGRMFDIYNDSFELTSRIAAYTTFLKDLTAEFKLKNPNTAITPEIELALKREAATNALELMNFRKAGEWGRAIAPLYMFFKPGAISAKFAYTAIRNAKISADSALKNLDPALWSRLTSKYEKEELEQEQAKPRPDTQKIAELQAAIDKNDEAKQKFIDTHNKRRKNAQLAIGVMIAAGMAGYLLSYLNAEDDEEGRNRVATDDKSRWTRYARFAIPGSKEFLQYPWGYGVGAFGATGAQLMALIMGHSSLKEFAGNMVEIAADSYMPLAPSKANPFDNPVAWFFGTVSPSFFKGFIELAFNQDNQGSPIYNARAGKYADAYSGTARPGEVHNWLSQTLFGVTRGHVDINPNTVAYLANMTSEGLNYVAELVTDLVLYAQDKKDLDIKKDIPLIKRFIGRESNYDAAQFEEASRWIEKEARRYRSYRDMRSPEEYDRYLDNNPNVPIISEMYDKTLNGSLSVLKDQRKTVQRMQDLSPKERKEILDDIDYNINAIKRNFVESYKDLRENYK